MATDTQARKWQLTINNPQTSGLDRERLLEIISRFSLDYFCICDEVAEVLDKTGRSKEDRELLGQIENKLSTIARQGRAFGVHLILAIQRPDATIIPGQIRNNLDYRVCGRAEKVLSEIILDNNSAAEQIPKDARGRFILHDGTVFQGYWFDEMDIGKG